MQELFICNIRNELSNTGTANKHYTLSLLKASFSFKLQLCRFLHSTMYL